jgi:hypothetical protein
VAVGKYLEVDRSHRLVFTFGMPQFAADFDTVSVVIEPDGDGCSLTLTQDGLRPGYEKFTVSGWGKMFDALTKALSEGGRLVRAGAPAPALDRARSESNSTRIHRRGDIHTHYSSYVWSHYNRVTLHPTQSPR